jgi:hypothetical protein
MVAIVTINQLQSNTTVRYPQFTPVRIANRKTARASNAGEKAERPEKWVHFPCGED